MTQEYLKNIQDRIAEDDEAALKELHDFFCNKLFQAALVMVNSRQMAEEIVQDVFIKLWEKRLQLKEIKDLKSYLYVIARNISLDYLRKMQRKISYSLDEIDLPPLMIEASPEDLMISTEVIKKINIAINNLPPKCKVIFRLVKLNGLKHREVAELLQINIKTVEAQMGIALKRVYASVLVYFPAYSRK